MDSGARNELNSIIKELNSIITEMESISRGVRCDFMNIGNDKCADCIDKVLNNYYTVKEKFDSMDTSTVAENYAQAHGGGSSC